MQTFVNYTGIGFYSEMAKEYLISKYRRVLVKKEASEFFITFEEINSEHKTMIFPVKRFVQLISFDFLIDQSVNSFIVKQHVDLKLHLGGGYYVSVTNGYEYVDVRLFYFNKQTGQPCPTRRGIALKFDEWLRVKEIFREIKLAFPEISNIEPCSNQPDHFTTEGYRSCEECQFFRHDEELFLQKKRQSYY
jgi:hypothetical protein